MGEESNLLINLCNELIDQECWKIKVSHCYQKANQAANKLANLGIDRSINIPFFHSPPKNIVNYVGAT